MRKAKKPEATTTAQKHRSNRVRIEDLSDLYERCAGVDVHKSAVTACVISGAGQQTEGEIREYGTTTADLRELRQWLQQAGVTHIAMESTGVYWHPVWQILERPEFTLVLANAREVRNMPGRKTDQADAIWLATLLRKGLIKASFIPPAEVRRLRDLCRSRSSLVRDRTRVVQRVEKVLEAANIKLDTVASDLMGVGPRKMLDRLAEGETDAGQLAELALRGMRSKIPQLAKALEGSFRPHQLFLLKQLLEQFDFLNRQIEQLEGEIEKYARPFEQQVAQLDSMPGVNRIAAISLLAETGVDMSQFSTPGQFCRWARMTPGNNISAGRKRSAATGKGNRWLRGMLVQCAWAATHQRDSYLSAQYKRVLHRGRQRALVAVGHSMLEAIWHMLRKGQDYADPGADYFEKQNLEQQKHACVKRLRNLGFDVELRPAA